MSAKRHAGTTARVTLQSVADRVGVSRMTVSNAFSRPDQLSSALRERILAAAGELGYSGPDPAGRTLARGRSGAIGVVLTDSLSYAFTDVVATTFLGAVAAEFEPVGVAMTLISIPRISLLSPAGDVALDGAIVYSVDGDSPALPWLARRRLPRVLVDQQPTDAGPTINVDDLGGATAVAGHLLTLGHRRIGIVTQGLSAPSDLLVDPTVSSPHYVIRQRLAGWLTPLRSAGITPLLVNLGRNGLDEGRRGAMLLLDADPQLTALICMSDLMAVGAISAAQTRGLRVPDDLSVVGFDAAPLVVNPGPSLTTVRQPVAEKGRLAAQAVLGAVDGTLAQPPPHVVLATELLVRDSTGPPRQASPSR